MKRVRAEFATTGPTISSGQLAREAGVSPRTVRYYEAKRLIGCAGLVKGRRRYNPNAVKAIRRIRWLQESGLSLEEIFWVLRGIADASTTRHERQRACEAALNRAAFAIEDRIRGMHRTLLQINELRELSRECGRCRQDDCRPCPTLERLTWFGD
jgi:DNA-binding transcriptional MerR regulator